MPQSFTAPASRVFNVVGIYLNGRGDSVEHSLRARLKPDRIETFAPIPRSATGESPAELIRRTGESIDRFLECCSREDGGSGRPAHPIVGIGRSFGGFMLFAAVAAEPRRLDAFSLLVAIEAPLSADVHVRIPPLLPVLLPARRHFEERPTHAAKMASVLLTAGGTNIVTIGSSFDGVSTPLSQRLTATSSTVPWSAENFALPPDSPVHVLLPSFAPGFAAETMLFPRSYRTHLSWSETKHEAIAQIIRHGLERAGSSSKTTWASGTGTVQRSVDTPHGFTAAGRGSFP